MLLAEAVKIGHKSRRKRSEPHTPFKRACPRSLPIDGKFRGRVGVAELPGPVGPVGFSKAMAKRGILPIGIIRILNGQGRKSSVLCVATGFPQQGSFLPEDKQRPSVGDEPVERQCQDMHVGFEPQQGHPKERSLS